MTLQPGHFDVGDTIELKLDSHICRKWEVVSVFSSLGEPKQDGVVELRPIDHEVVPVGRLLIPEPLLWAFTQLSIG